MNTLNNINALIKNALVFAERGNYQEAKKKLQKINKKYPNNSAVLANLGLLEIQTQNYKNAENYFKNSWVIKFNIDIFKNYIQTLSIQKKWKKLEDEINKLKTNELDQDIFINYAIALRELGDIDKFQLIYEKLVRKYPKFENAWVSYGFSLNKYKLYDKAIKVFKESLSYFPNSFLILYNLGISFANIYDAKNSIIYLTKASQINENSFSLWITLAAQQAKMRLFDDAQLSLNRCRKIEPENQLILFQEATIEMFLGNVKKSEELLSRLLIKDPSHIDGNYHMGIINLIKGDFEKANQYYRYRIKNIDMTVKFDDFETIKLDSHKKILIGWEQGIGDQFLYFRLMEDFLKKYKKITYIATDKTTGIFKKNYPEIEVISDSDYERDKKNYESYQKINLASIMQFIPSIQDALSKARHIKIEDVTKKNNKNKKVVGLSWKSENKRIGKEKSLGLSNLNVILENENLDFVSLQYGCIKNELKQLKEEIPKINFDYDEKIDYFNDIETLIRKIDCCDLVITISNVTAHLAGSMNKPTIVLVPKTFGKLWYWYNNDQSSIWYPSVKIIKQKIDKSWINEINEVNNYIKRFYLNSANN